MKDEKLSNPSVIPSKLSPMFNQHRQQAIAQQRDTMDGCLAVYEAMRRLGFTPGEIFFDLRIVGTPGVAGLGDASPCVGMTLRAQGKEFKTNCGPRINPAFLSDDELLATWDHHAAKWNTGMTDTRRMEIWCTKMPPQLLLSLVLSLKRMGFIFPNPAFESQVADVTGN
jgi:hypothetical protein